MAAKKTSPGFDFIVAALKKNPKAAYKDIAAAAAKKKLKVFPVMFGGNRLHFAFHKVTNHVHNLISGLGRCNRQRGLLLFRNVGFEP